MGKPPLFLLSFVHGLLLLSLGWVLFLVVCKKLACMHLRVNYSTSLEAPPSPNLDPALVFPPHLPSNRSRSHPRHLRAPASGQHGSSPAEARDKRGTGGWAHSALCANRGCTGRGAHPHRERGAGGRRRRSYRWGTRLGCSCAGTVCTRGARRRLRRTFATGRALAGRAGTTAQRGRWGPLSPRPVPQCSRPQSPPRRRRRARTKGATPPLKNHRYLLTIRDTSMDGS